MSGDPLKTEARRVRNKRNAVHNNRSKNMMLDPLCFQLFIRLEWVEIAMTCPFFGRADVMLFPSQLNYL